MSLYWNGHRTADNTRKQQSLVEVETIAFSLAVLGAMAEILLFKQLLRSLAYILAADITQ